MCYARRQRSSWARIKLSNVCIYILTRGYTSELIPLYCFKSIFWNSLEFFRASSLPLQVRSCACCCSIFKELAASRGQLCYYITSSPPCQHLFSIFFIFFRIYFFSQSVRISVLDMPLSTCYNYRCTGGYDQAITKSSRSLSEHFIYRPAGQSLPEEFICRQ